MPIYEYNCNICNEFFALLHRYPDTNNVACPRCGSNNIKKLISRFNCSSVADPGSTGGGSSSGFGGGG